MNGHHSMSLPDEDLVSITNIVKYQELKKVFPSIIELQNAITQLPYDLVDTDLEYLKVLAKDYVQSEEKVKDIAKLLYEKSTSDREFAKKAAIICDHFSLLEHKGTKFRTVLLSLIQSDYEDREQLRSTSKGEFLGFFTFLCQVYGTFKTDTGEFMKILINPVYECLRVILDTGDGDEVECMCLQMQSIGKILEGDSEDKMMDFMNSVRLKIIHKSSSRIRCMLLETHEQYLRGWRTLPNETTRFYCDAMADILADAVI